MPSSLEAECRRLARTRLAPYITFVEDNRGIPRDSWMSDKPEHNSLLAFSPEEVALCLGDGLNGDALMKDSTFNINTCTVLAGDRYAFGPMISGVRISAKTNWELLHWTLEILANCTPTNWLMVVGQTYGVERLTADVAPADLRAVIPGVIKIMSGVSSYLQLLRSGNPQGLAYADFIDVFLQQKASERRESTPTFVGYSPFFDLAKVRTLNWERLVAASKGLTSRVPALLVEKGDFDRVLIDGRIGT